ncbi:hypothetical protein [Winogradskyella sp. 3972H.M.0a.05]|uniref:hypothetical protein n=1 Tax=Winogradskyella sp. 3972H.M.0a.05 TaxID=2950277 RepID=UPI0033987280
MRLLTTLLLMMTFFCEAQKKNIATHSVALQDFITFVVDSYPTVSGELQKPKHINFLLQVGEEGYNSEDRIIIQQAFKLLSNRLTEGDVVSISTYSQMNGIALKEGDPKDIKGLLYTLDNLKSSIKEFHDDGISMAYKYMEDHFSEELEHSIVIVRNPNASTKGAMVSSENQKKKTKQKNNAVVLTAIALLPELIAVIKD